MQISENTHYSAMLEKPTTSEKWLSKKNAAFQKTCLAVLVPCSSVGLGLSVLLGVLCGFGDVYLDLLPASTGWK